MAVRQASAQWKGDLREGDGTVRTESGAVDGAYTFASRFEDGSGTNPDELLGAALASCYSMALAHDLAGAGHVPESVSTEARVHFEKGEDGYGIPKIELVATARVPGIDRGAFLEHAEKIKRECHVARTLTGTEITLDATLEG